MKPLNEEQILEISVEMSNALSSADAPDDAASVLFSVTLSEWTERIMRLYNLSKNEMCSIMDVNKKTLRKILNNEVKPLEASELYKALSTLNKYSM